MIRERIVLLRRIRKTYRLMKTDFLPPAPDLSGKIMRAVYDELPLQSPGAQDPVSFRSWIAVGLVSLASLIAYPMGLAYEKMAGVLGTELLLPIALTLGISLTVYCALFIVSHLEELSERFGLRHG